MKTRFKFKVAHNGYNASVGDVLEIDNGLAIWLEVQGIGEIVDGIKEPVTVTIKKDESKDK